jgi:hypothetical protein
MSESIWEVSTSRIQVKNVTATSNPLGISIVIIKCIASNAGRQLILDDEKAEATCRSPAWSDRTEGITLRTDWHVVFSRKFTPCHKK